MKIDADKIKDMLAMSGMWAAIIVLGLRMIEIGTIGIVITSVALLTGIVITNATANTHLAKPKPTPKPKPVPKKKDK